MSLGPQPWTGFCDFRTQTGILGEEPWIAPVPLALVVMAADSKSRENLAEKAGSAQDPAEPQIRKVPHGACLILCVVFKKSLKSKLSPATVRAALCCQALVFWSSGAQVQGRDNHGSTTQTAKAVQKNKQLQQQSGSLFQFLSFVHQDCTWNNRSLGFFLVASCSHYLQHACFLQPAVIHPPRWRQGSII